MDYQNIDNMSEEQIKLREAQIRSNITQSVGREESVEENVIISPTSISLPSCLCTTIASLTLIVGTILGETIT